MPLFRLSQSPDDSGNFPIVPDDVKHLTRVLRLKDGDRFEVRLPTGEKAGAVLQNIGKKWVGTLTKILSSRPEVALPVRLGIGLIRWPRLEWLVEKTTELGVARITPLTLQFSQVLSKDYNSKIKRLNKISQETLKQCERAVAPQIDAPVDLKGFLKSLSDAPSLRKIYLGERCSGAKFTWKNLQPSPDGEWVLIVGPEGGFHSKEIERLTRNGFTGFSLGESIYRSETAALYALSVLDFVIQSRTSE